LYRFRTEDRGARGFLAAPRFLFYKLEEASKRPATPWWMTNSSRDELLQPLLEVHPGDAYARRDRGARSAQDQMTSTGSFSAPF
jgi:hypothetical protein